MGSKETPSPLGLIQRLHDKKVSRKDLQDAAQLAVQVEFSTIPVYLTGLYSISDTSSNAYQLLRSVVMEEMFHVNQAANILVSLGGTPKFTGDHAPVYPCYLPQANPSTTAYLGLYQASQAVFGDVYAAIETPAPADAPPQGDNYDSIAQLYEALVQGIKTFEKQHPNEKLFLSETSHGCQRTDIYLGKFGGTVLKVTDNHTALAAVEQIVRQGEGTVPNRKPLVPDEPFGAYQHYGHRTDGTYGPILGTPTEMSHFTKFQSVALSSGAFPPTAPITSNPDPETYTNPAAKKLSDQFDIYYSKLLHALEASFDPKFVGENPYFGVALTIMHKILPNLATSLMQTPIFKQVNSSIGPYAAPAWRYRSHSRSAQALAAGQDELVQLIVELDVPDYPNDAARRQALKTMLGQARDGVAMLAGQCPGLDI